ncbi:ATP-dependent helicase [Hyunsoonleella sp. SJ7]|uniref:ATP-dependent helicase n=1 Tax=Hyunsoonleella aquatilis TaxID=2762758 RepID=A0A923KLB0_9FLAO|nr:UvrD-helicase domain-containing protein [Hyunsoonleella aquatilis]MBC3757730.1 ATP-dependent helicase [Hyunsoonleella aquatilis]
MKLTAEQIKIINSTGNIKINAVAGSGKTTTLIEYAKARPPRSKILYLAFNKSVKLEALKKFQEKGATNVTIETAHSLAFKKTVLKHNYKLRPQGLKTYEVADILELRSDGEKHIQYILANHINKFASYFCNSNTPKIKDLNYLDVVFDVKARNFINTFYNYIEKNTRLLLSKMDSGEIEITHDFYLKKFQLSNPKLDFDYILFDEGQDASPAMLDIFLKQNATKVIVGDTHQQIYGWRHAVNSLENTDFKTYQLSTSFRFNQDIANLSVEVLKWKKHINNNIDFSIKGKGSTQIYSSKAILARTNLGLLLKAIEYATEKKKIKHIYFEGNINSYTYADEGASLYDILNLYNRRYRRIKDKLIKQMKSLGELENYIEKTDDVQLGLMLEIVRKYGNKIPNIIKRIKAKHIENNDKSKAEIIFSTVHRCKGMEYDAIQLVNDFITEDTLEKLKLDIKKGIVEISKMNEEINLLYVAITRTKNSIHIPETLMPKNFPRSSKIHITPVKSEEEKALVKNTKTTVPEQDIFREKAYSVEKIRKKHLQAYRPWTSDLDEKLITMYYDGISIRELSQHFGRTNGAIRSRIKKLELKRI